jgi:hypothetical protein
MGTGAAFAFVSTPGMTQRIAENPETAILVFMVPLILLIGVMILEVGRVVVIGRMPDETPLPPRRKRHWRAVEAGGGERIAL